MRICKGDTTETLWFQYKTHKEKKNHECPALRTVYGDSKIKRMNLTFIFLWNKKIKSYSELPASAFYIQIDS